MNKKLNNLIFDLFDEEKRIEARKNILSRKLERIKRMQKSKLEIEALEKELDKIQNERN
jgi:hypothetical protein